MAFKLSKEQRKRKAELVAKLTEAKGFVADACSQYNQVLEEVASFKDDLAGEFRDAIDEKSDAWKEGERGEAADQFTTQWEEFDADGVEAPDMDHAEQLDNLPDEAD